MILSKVCQNKDVGYLLCSKRTATTVLQPSRTDFIHIKEIFNRKTTHVL